MNRGRIRSALLSRHLAFPGAAGRRCTDRSIEGARAAPASGLGALLSLKPESMSTAPAVLCPVDRAWEIDAPDSAKRELPAYPGSLQGKPDLGAALPSAQSMAVVGQAHCLELSERWARARGGAVRSPGVPGVSGSTVVAHGQGAYDFSGCWRLSSRWPSCRSILMSI